MEQLGQIQIWNSWGKIRYGTVGANSDMEQLGANSDMEQLEENTYEEQLGGGGKIGNALGM